KRLGKAAIPVVCDVADETSVDLAVQETIQAFGGIDLLINNAGLHSAAYNKGFRELGIAGTRRLFDVNVMGVINCTLACRESMSQRGGGAILNIASIAGYNISTTYGVSKLAVRGLTIAFAKELSPDAIRVNAIAPGLIATDTIRAEMPQSLFDQFLEMQPIKRPGEVSDIVSAMLCLRPDEASFVTGETLKVAGGDPLQSGPRGACQGGKRLP